MVPCVENALLWRRSQFHVNCYVIHGIYCCNLPQNQSGTSFTLLMSTSFLKLLSHLCQRRFSPGNHKKATEVSFCNRPVHTQGKNLSLTSWSLSGCHMDLGKPSTLAPTYSTNFWSRAGTFSAKVSCWVVLFLSLIGLCGSILIWMRK